MKRFMIVLLLISGLFMIFKLWHLKIITCGVLLVGVSLTGVFIQDYFTEIRFNKLGKRRNSSKD